MSKSNTTYDIITVGDATIDMFLEIDEATVQCDIDRQACKLQLDYASKIPVTHTKRVVGVGNAANHAVAAKKLGLKSAIYTVVGGDDCGVDIIRALKKKKVATEYVAVDANKGTNYSTVINYKEDRTILVYHVDRTYKLPRFAKTKWLYFSSASGNHKELNDSVVQYVTKNKVKLGFNPGTMQMKLGVRKLKTVLEVCDVLFVNKEEAERLVGRKKDVKRLLVSLYKKGPKSVVITDGQKGSYLYDGSTMHHCGIFDQAVVERTGAGDAYASGYVAALIHGETPQEAMRWGSFNAAGVVQYAGSQEGLLSKKDMAMLTKKHRKFQATEI